MSFFFFLHMTHESLCMTHHIQHTYWPSNLYWNNRTMLRGPGDDRGSVLLMIGGSRNSWTEQRPWKSDRQGCGPWLWHFLAVTAVTAAKTKNPLSLHSSFVKEGWRRRKRRWWCCLISGLLIFKESVRVQCTVCYLLSSSSPICQRTSHQLSEWERSIKFSMMKGKNAIITLVKEK